MVDMAGEEASPSASAVERMRVIYVINEMWFFRSHFVAWALSARDSGLSVEILAAPGSGPAEPGLTCHASVARRGGLVPTGLWATAGQLRDLAGRGGDVVVHAFGLHGMAITVLARLRGLATPRVVSITGLGFIATLAPSLQWLARLAVGALARLCDRGRTVWLAENDSDPGLLGLSAAIREGRVVTLTGAGVDTANFPVAPLPAAPPLRLVFIARLIRSKGLDIVVEALRLARAAGQDVTLTIIGDADRANPRALTAEDLAAIAREPGVQLLGRRDDVAAQLGEHHLFVLPSRGGEGLPRALLEAAAAGRAAIVSDVPGCRDFVEDGRTGFVVPAEDPRALAEAIQRAAGADLAAMGSQARAKVVRLADIRKVTGTVVGIYRRLFAGGQ